MGSPLGLVNIAGLWVLALIPLLLWMTWPHKAIIPLSNSLVPSVS